MEQRWEGHASLPARCASKKSGRDLAKAPGLITLKISMEVKDDDGNVSEVASCSLGVTKTLEQAEIIASKLKGAEDAADLEARVKVAGGKLRLCDGEGRLA